MRSVERVPLTSAAANPITLYSDTGNLPGRPSSTLDGSAIVFEQSYGHSREIWVKDTTSGQQRMVLRVDSPLNVDAIISPDGNVSRIR